MELLTLWILCHMYVLLAEGKLVKCWWYPSKQKLYPSVLIATCKIISYENRVKHLAHHHCGKNIKVGVRPLWFWTANTLVHFLGRSNTKTSLPGLKVKLCTILIWLIAFVFLAWQLQIRLLVVLYHSNYF